jgi:hypothetical protein
LDGFEPRVCGRICGLCSLSGRIEPGTHFLGRRLPTDMAADNLLNRFFLQGHDFGDHSKTQPGFSNGRPRFRRRCEGFERRRNWS